MNWEQSAIFLVNLTSIPDIGQIHSTISSKINLKKVISTEVPGTFKTFVAVIFDVIEAPQSRPNGQNLGIWTWIRIQIYSSLFLWIHKVKSSKYIQDQWDISANVNNFLGFFITYSFPNSTTDWEKNAVDEGSLTLIFRLRLAPFQLSPLLFVSLCSAFSFWLFLSGWSP